MKSISIKNNFKSIARVAFICFLVLLMALGPANIQEIFADEQIGMKWTRLKNEGDLYNALYDGNHTAFSDSSAWKPIMIIYESGGKYYYTQSGSIYSNDHENQLGGVKVTASSGVEPGKDSFVTRTNCNSIFAKYLQDDGGKHEYGFAYRSYNTVSNVGICLNMSWWGCPYAACAYGEFLAADRSNPDAYCFKRKGSCNKTSHKFWRVQSTENNAFEIMWWTSDRTTSNRHWCVSPGNIWISSDSDDLYRGFQIYVGEECANAIQTTSSEVQPFMATKLANYTIKSGVEIVVREGACYVLDGKNWNCGHIVVDGGTLVVRGVLDADENGQSSSGKYGKYNTSDIHILNGGQLIVERSGVIVNRNDSSGIYLDESSTAYVEGTIVCALTMKIGKNCSLRAMPGSFIAVGCRPLSEKGADVYTPDSIANNKDTYLSNIAYAANPNDSRLILGDNSSFISYGGVFIPSTANITYGNNTYTDSWFSTNINATIGSMMKQW